MHVYKIDRSHLLDAAPLALPPTVAARRWQTDRQRSRVAASRDWPQRENGFWKDWHFRLNWYQVSISAELRDYKVAFVLESGVIRLVFRRPWYMYKMVGNFRGCSQIEVSSKVSPPIKK